MLKLTILTLSLMLAATFSFGCGDDDPEPSSESDNILGFSLLEELSGHWVGSNKTAFGDYDWFAFDFRPISASHLHSIYEGGTNSNIITSIFIADFEGEQKIMGRNGGWLGNQYRATYFVLDVYENTDGSSYYRLVDAVGKENRAYMEFRFENDTMYFDAYKDNSGTLDQPLHHMGFKGTNYNPSFADAATNLFSYPQAVSEVDLENKFTNLIDPDSALFLEENEDPFPKSQHGHLSDLVININRDNSIPDAQLLLYLSTEPLVNTAGEIDFENTDTKVVRTIDVLGSEDFYETTYLHPDNYYITAFADNDANLFPSSGDISSVSKAINVSPESTPDVSISVDTQIP